MDHVLCGHLLILIIFTYFCRVGSFFRSVIIKRNIVIYFVGGWVGRVGGLDVGGWVS